MSINEPIIENAALEWFGDLGYAVGRGPQLAPGEPTTKRDSFGEMAPQRVARNVDGAAAAGAGGAEHLAGRNGPAGSLETAGRGPA